jgi:hypothetical protein
MVPNRTLLLLLCLPSSWPCRFRRGVGVNGVRSPLRELLRVQGSDPLACAGEVLALVP